MPPPIRMVNYKKQEQTRNGNAGRTGRQREWPPSPAGGWHLCCSHSEERRGCVCSGRIEVNGRATHAEGDIFQPLLHSPSSHNCQVWASMKPRAGNCNLSLTGVTGAQDLSQELQPLSHRGNGSPGLEPHLQLSGALGESWMGGGAAGLQPALCCDMQVLQGRLSRLYHQARPESFL